MNVEQLKKAVIDLKDNGTTIVFSSHRMEHVEEMCEHLCILHKGKPIVQGILKDIKRSYGKKNLVIHADFDLEELKNFSGVTNAKTTTEGISLQIKDEEVSSTYSKEYC